MADRQKGESSNLGRLRDRSTAAFSYTQKKQTKKVHLACAYDQQTTVM